VDKTIDGAKAGSGAGFVAKMPPHARSMQAMRSRNRVSVAFKDRGDRQRPGMPARLISKSSSPRRLAVSTTVPSGCRPGIEGGGGRRPTQKILVGSLSTPGYELHRWEATPGRATSRGGSDSHTLPKAEALPWRLAPGAKPP
jgi:hypothetical protein